MIIAKWKTSGYDMLVEGFDKKTWGYPVSVTMEKSGVSGKDVSYLGVCRIGTGIPSAKEVSEMTKPGQAKSFVIFVGKGDSGAPMVMKFSTCPSSPIPPDIGYAVKTFFSWEASEKIREAFFEKTASKTASVPSVGSIWKNVFWHFPKNG